MEEFQEVVDAPCIIKPERCYCGAALKPFIACRFFVRGPDGKEMNLRTVFYYCKSCDFAIRGLDCSDPIVATHYELTNYTIPERDDHWREKRRKFFIWFYRLAIEHLGGKPETVLDYGCSYGHLLDIFADNGAKTFGVEVAPQMFDKLTREGRHRVYRTIEDTDIADGSFDLITAIDSMYYTDIAPGDLLALFARKLKLGGLLITRTTNRNQIHKIYAWRWHLIHGKLPEPAPLAHRVCGDAMLNFSERFLSKHLEPAGLKKVATYRWEKKKKRTEEYIRDAVVLFAYYASVGRIDLCPGLVIVAQKKDTLE
jgi:SAM-dependent methyltransferase